MNLDGPSTKYSREQLLQATSQGHRIPFLFFWGHRPSRTGAVGPGCLSQWWEVPFLVEDQRYLSAEHFMMAEKARLFGDESTRAQILAARNAGQAKALGQEVHGFDEAQWVAHRYDIVLTGNLAKFGQHPPLQSFLLQTGDRVLVEASPMDRIWGIGLAKEDSRAQDPRLWRGLNLLGFALMEVRDMLGKTF